MKKLKDFIARFGKLPQGERGQVLILTGLAGTVLLGFMALSLDLGNLYFTRRSAQNAADAAALVGAQDWTGVAPNVIIVANNAVRDARQYAVNNGFVTNTGANNGVWNGEVRVDVPPATGPNAGKPDYIEVNIKRQVNTLFAGLLGFNNVQISARAVARSQHIGLTAATISLDPGDPSTYTNGSTAINVLGNTYSRGVTQSITGVINVNGNAYARGGFQGTGINANNLITNVPDLLDPDWSAPTANSGPGVSWNSNGVVEKSTMDDDGYEWISPGTYDWISISAGYKVKFQPGVYHVTKNQGVSINGTAIGTGPVCFVLDNPASFSVQAGANVNFYSSSAYNNIVIWSSDTGDAVKIAGGGNVSLTGTIYTPYGNSRIAGTAGGTVHGQVVAKDIVLEGTSGTAVVYDGNNAPDTPGPTLVE